MADFVQVNVNMTNKDVRMLSRMMREDAYDNRSAWVRHLIRKEWARRKKRETISVADSMELELEEAEEMPSSSGL
jgi:Arc/MetJ-type ribon-helix-helix transcriptional regulator